MYPDSSSGSAQQGLSWHLASVNVERAIHFLCILMHQSFVSPKWDWRYRVGRTTLRPGSFCITGNQLVIIAGNQLVIYLSVSD